MARTKQDIAEYKRQWYLKNIELCKDRAKNYAIKNADKLKIQKKEYRKKYREKLNAQCKNLYAKNKKRYKETQKKYYEKNKEQIKIYQHKWYTENKDKIKQYGKRYRSRKYVKVNRQISNNKRYAQKKQTCNGTVTKVTVAEKLLAQKDKCVLCSIIIKDQFHIDHVVPLSKGGQHRIENIQLLCPKCNLTKNDKIL